MPLQSIITYDGLPISSGGGHTLRTRGAKSAWAGVRHFMASCTNSPAPQSSFVEVLVGDGVPGDFSDRLVRRFDAELGKCAEPSICGSDECYSWPLAIDQIDRYVAVVESEQPLPPHPHRLQPIAVTVLFHFLLVDNSSRRPLPRQEPADYADFSPSYGQLLGQSKLYARISEQSSASLFLNFPYAESSQSFLETAAFVQEHLPFRLSTKHWKQWHLAKSGKGYVGRKINFEGLRT